MHEVCNVCGNKRPVGFLVMAPNMHWCMTWYRSWNCSQKVCVSFVAKNDGYGSRPRSAGCSKPTQPPRAAISPNIPRTMRKSAEPTLTACSSFSVRLGRQIQGCSRARKGRGAAWYDCPGFKGTCLAAEIVQHGGDPKPPKTDPESIISSKKFSHE